MFSSPQALPLACQSTCLSLGMKTGPKQSCQAQAFPLPAAGLRTVFRVSRLRAPLGRSILPRVRASAAAKGSAEIADGVAKSTLETAAVSVVESAGECLEKATSAWDAMLEEGIMDQISRWLYFNKLPRNAQGEVDLLDFLPEFLHKPLHNSEALAVITVRELLVASMHFALFLNVSRICWALNWLWGTYVMQDEDVTVADFRCRSGFGAAVNPLKFVVVAAFLTRHARLFLPLVKCQLRPLLVRRLRESSLLIAVVWFLLNWKNLAIRAVILENEGDRPRLATASRFLSLLVIFGGVLVFAEVWGVALRSLFAIGGVSGIAIGFASKEIFSNFFGGLVLFISHPFQIGDRIKAGPVEGTVLDIGFTRTKLLGFDKNLVIVPNQVFLSAVIINMSRSTHNVLSASFQLRNEDIQRIRPITVRISEMLRSRPEMDLTQETPSATLRSLGPTGLEVGLRGVTKSMPGSKFYAMQQEILEQAAEIILEEGGVMGWSLPIVSPMGLPSKGSPPSGRLQWIPKFIQGQ